MAARDQSERGKSAATSPPVRLGLSHKTRQAILVNTKVMLAPEVVGRAGNHAYDWAPGQYYAVAPYAADGMVSRCGKDGREVAVQFEIRDITAGGEGVQLSVSECKKVQKLQYYFFQAVEFLLPGKFLFTFSAKSTKWPNIEPVQYTITVTTGDARKNKLYGGHISSSSSVPPLPRSSSTMLNSCGPLSRSGPGGGVGSAPSVAVAAGGALVTAAAASQHSGRLGSNSVSGGGGASTSGSSKPSHKGFSMRSTMTSPLPSLSSSFSFSTVKSTTPMAAGGASPAIPAPAASTSAQPRTSATSTAAARSSTSTSASSTINKSNTSSSTSSSANPPTREGSAKVPKKPRGRPRVKEKDPAAAEGGSSGGSPPSSSKGLSVAATTAAATPTVSTSAAKNKKGAGGGRAGGMGGGGGGGGGVGDAGGGGSQVSPPLPPRLFAFSPSGDVVVTPNAVLPPKYSRTSKATKRNATTVAAAGVGATGVETATKGNKGKLKIRVVRGANADGTTLPAGMAAAPRGGIAGAAGDASSSRASAPPPATAGAAAAAAAAAAARSVSSVDVRWGGSTGVRMGVAPPPPVGKAVKKGAVGQGFPQGHGGGRGTGREGTAAPPVPRPVIGRKRPISAATSNSIAGAGNGGVSAGASADAAEKSKKPKKPRKKEVVVKGTSGASAYPAPTSSMETVAGENAQGRVSSGGEMSRPSASAPATASTPIAVGGRKKGGSGGSKGKRKAAIDGATATAGPTAGPTTSCVSPTKPKKRPRKDEGKNSAGVSAGSKDGAVSKEKEEERRERKEVRVAGGGVGGSEDGGGWVGVGSGGGGGGGGGSGSGGKDKKEKEKVVRKSGKKKADKGMPTEGGLPFPGPFRLPSGLLSINPDLPMPGVPPAGVGIGVGAGDGVGAAGDGGMGLGAASAGSKGSAAPISPFPGTGPPASPSTAAAAAAWAAMGVDSVFPPTDFVMKRGRGRPPTPGGKADLSRIAKAREAALSAAAIAEAAVADMMAVGAGASEVGSDGAWAFPLGQEQGNEERTEDQDAANIAASVDGVEASEAKNRPPGPISQDVTAPSSPTVKKRKKASAKKTDGSDSATVGKSAATPGERKAAEAMVAAAAGGGLGTPRPLLGTPASILGTPESIFGNPGSIPGTPGTTQGSPTENGRGKDGKVVKPRARNREKEKISRKLRTERKKLEAAALKAKNAADVGASSPSLEPAATGKDNAGVLSSSTPSGAKKDASPSTVGAAGSKKEKLNNDIKSYFNKKDGQTSSSKKDGQPSSSKKDRVSSSSKRDGMSSPGKKDGMSSPGKKDGMTSSSKKDGQSSSSRKDTSSPSSKKGALSSSSKKDGQSSSSSLKNGPSSSSKKDGQSSSSSMKNGPSSSSKKDGQSSSSSMKNGPSSSSKKDGLSSPSKKEGKAVFGRKDRSTKVDAIVGNAGAGAVPEKGSSTSGGGKRKADAPAYRDPELLGTIAGTAGTPSATTADGMKKKSYKKRKKHQEDGQEVSPRAEGEGAEGCSAQGSLSPDSKKRAGGLVSQKKKEKARKEQKKDPEDREAGKKGKKGRKGAADRAEAAASTGAAESEGPVPAPEVTVEPSPEKKKKGEKKTARGKEKAAEQKEQETLVVVEEEAEAEAEDEVEKVEELEESEDDDDTPMPPRLEPPLILAEHDLEFGCVPWKFKSADGEIEVKLTAKLMGVIIEDTLAMRKGKIVRLPRDPRVHEVLDMFDESIRVDDVTGRQFIKLLRILFDGMFNTAMDRPCFFFPGEAEAYVGALEAEERRRAAVRARCQRVVRGIASAPAAGPRVEAGAGSSMGSSAAVKGSVDDTGVKGGDRGTDDGNGSNHQQHGGSNESDAAGAANREASSPPLPPGGVTSEGKDTAMEVDMPAAATVAHAPGGSPPATSEEVDASTSAADAPAGSTKEGARVSTALPSDTLNADELPAAGGGAKLAPAAEAAPLEVVDGKSKMSGSGDGAVAAGTPGAAVGEGGEQGEEVGMPGEIFGPEHLLRFLVALPSMLDKSYNENYSVQKMIPGSRKYPAKMNKMLVLLVNLLEDLLSEGAFDREYVTPPCPPPPAQDSSLPLPPQNPSPPPPQQDPSSPPPPHDPSHPPPQQEASAAPRPTVPQEPAPRKAAPEVASSV